MSANCSIKGVHTKMKPIIRQNRFRAGRYFLSALILLSFQGFTIEIPVASDSRLTVELVAQEPDILTPTGLCVDEGGRVWAIENNTHFRPKNYKAFASDRIQIFSDFAPDGRAKKITTFADGFQNSMGLAFDGKDGVVLATRSEIFLLHDTKNTGTADERKTIAKLETKGNYPHNGLAGLAFGADGWLYFGLGENLGAPYKLSGSDGATLSGGGEGGNVYRCQPDGSKLQRFATGFWNPFGLRFDPYGKLFAVDNDPDGRPPCRLLHVIQGGDYGFRFRYGRGGSHPFQAWVGELPGTLGMISGCGEAPCSVLSCEFTGFPKEYGADLISTAWGDHVIQRFKLNPDGASFKSTPESFITGGAEFRPVTIAPAPDGSLLVTDWASTSYPVHGKGRIWRVRAKDAADDRLRGSKVKDMDGAKLRSLLSDSRPAIRNAAASALAQTDAGAVSLIDALKNEADWRVRFAALSAGAGIASKRAAVIELGLQDKAPEVRAAAVKLLAAETANADTEQKLLALMQADESSSVRLESILHLNDKSSAEKLLPLLGNADPFIASAAIETLSRIGDTASLLKASETAAPPVKVGIVLVLRRAGDTAAQSAIPKFLSDPSLDVRRAAVQWIGDEHLTAYADQLAEVGRGPMSRALFDAFVAARSLLSDKGGKTDSPESLMALVFADAAQPAQLRAMALQNLGIDHPAASVAKLKELLASPDADLKAEAIRALALHSHADAQPELRTLAADAKLNVELRGDVIAGLARSSPASPETRQVLIGLLDAGQPVKLQREALRSLRGAAAQPDVLPALQKYSDALAAADKGMVPELAEQMMFALKSSNSNLDAFGNLAKLIEKRPKSVEEWQAAVHKPGSSGDAAAGGRLFFHARGAQCFVCHRINGRGGNVGPELSNIGQTGTHDKILISVLDPSREVAPEFVPWSFKLKDGRVLTGVIQDEDINGNILLADSQGKKIKIRPSDIDKRASQKGTLMPDNLSDLLTVQELRDLMAFLAKCQRGAQMER